MAVNVTQFAVNGIHSVGWAALNGYYPHGTSGALTNGSSAGLGSLDVNAFNFTLPESAVTYAQANNGVLTSFRQQPQELPSGTMASAKFDMDFSTKATGLKVNTEGDWDVTELFPKCFSYADLMLVINSPANSLETATLDEAGYFVWILYKVQFDAQAFAQLQTATIAEFSAGINLKRSAYTNWGVNLTTSTNGTSQAVGRAFYSPNPIWLHTLVGNGSATTVTLDKTPAAANIAKVKVWNNGTALTYTTDYTVDTSTKVVTYTAAPAAGVNSVVLYQFVPTC